SFFPRVRRSRGAVLLSETALSAASEQMLERQRASRPARWWLPRVGSAKSHEETYDSILLCPAVSARCLKKQGLCQLGLVGTSRKGYYLAPGNRFVFRIQRELIVAALVGALAAGCATGWREPTRDEVLQRILPSAVQIVVEQREGRRVRTA